MLQVAPRQLAHLHGITDSCQVSRSLRAFFAWRPWNRCPPDRCIKSLSVSEQVRFLDSPLVDVKMFFLCKPYVTRAHDAHNTTGSRNAFNEEGRKAREARGKRRRKALYMAQSVNMAGSTTGASAAKMTYSTTQDTSITGVVMYTGGVESAERGGPTHHIKRWIYEGHERRIQQQRTARKRKTKCRGPQARQASQAYRAS